MRLGGPVFEKCADPDAWVAAMRRLGYSAAYCPVKDDAPREEVALYAAAAANHNIVLAEVGAWSNPLSPDAAKRTEAIELCRRRLALADELGARCCVNIAGSVGTTWHGPCPRDLTAETFDLIVQTIRGIIDAVRPRRTFYTLETMQWLYPDSPDSYLRLLKAIDRQRFSVHLDPTNLIYSPHRYFDTAAVIRECFQKLGPHIKSCHAKDIVLADKLAVHLDEVPPGRGGMDYRTYLRELGKLDPDTPLMMEHMKPEEYPAAAEFIRGVAREVGVQIR